MILVNEPLFLGKEKEYLAQCIDTKWVSSDGPFVRQFEELFAAYLGVKHAVAVFNGTVAIELALAALDLQPGDEVILPAHTIVSCPMGIIRRGCVPVLVDVDPQTWNMDINQLESKISPRTKAVMPVHIFGQSCDMDPLLALAEKYGLYIIEDAAEVHGAEYKGRKCGAMGHVSTFSFYANKIITTGEGGMIATNDDDIAARARYYRNLCFQPQQRFLHEDLGYNFRMTNLQAALGVAQMEKIEDLICIKQEQGRNYTSRLQGVPGLYLQQVEPYAKHVYWVFGLLLDDSVPFDAFEWAQVLLQNGVQTRPFFWPLHQQPVFHKMGLFREESYPVAERIARRGLYVPSGMGLTLPDLETVCEIVKKTLNSR
ncbi:MAG: DegT/DnrJ/EryC1/StrS family aminotransferase [Adhaeribacter sp.]